MAKRFTDSEKWKNEWFLSLPNDYKIIWIYLLDNCSIAGILKKNFKILNFCCETVGIDGSKLMEIFKDRVLDYGDFYFIPKFLLFQNPTGLNSDKPAVISIRKELKLNGLSDKVRELFGNDYLMIEDSKPNINESFNNRSRTIKGKGKGISIGIGKEEEGMGEETKPATPKKFTPPTALEVAKYADSLNFPLDGETFIAYYQARGWKDIKDWKACVVTWKKNAPKFNGKENKDAADLYESRKKYGRCTICGQKLRIENGLKLCLACEPQNLSTPAIPLVIKPIRDGPT